MEMDHSFSTNMIGTIQRLRRVRSWDGMLHLDINIELPRHSPKRVRIQSAGRDKLMMEAV